jgi:hypothetical protein
MLLIRTLKGQAEWTLQARAASDVRAVDESARPAATAWQQSQRLATPERGAVVQRAKEPVEFARRQGYRVDELLEIIEEVA